MMSFLYWSGLIRNNDAALCSASCALGAVTIPRCSACLRTMSTRQRGIGVAVSGVFDIVNYKHCYSFLPTRPLTPLGPQPSASGTGEPLQCLAKAHI